MRKRAGRWRRSAISVSSPLRIVRTPRFRRECNEVLAGDPRRADALEGFEHVVSRNPELGMAVAGQDGCYGRPIHTGTASYLIVDTVVEEAVCLLSIRKVPSGTF